MTQQSTFFPLQGGLDQITQAINVPPGRCIAASNHEAISTGYGRISGFERFDGHPSPTEASNAVINDLVAARAARDAARALIQPVPGSGVVRGVARFKGATYAWRDAEDGLSCVMWKSSPTGWVAVNLGWTIGFTSGGTYVVKVGDTITAATGGGTAIVRDVRLTSGTWAAGTAAGTLTLSDFTGTFTAGDLNVGANLNVASFTVAPVAQTFPPGGRYFTIINNFYGGVATRAIYGCNGVGKGFTFDGNYLIFIPTGSVPDTPIRVGKHKNILVFGFPGGSLQGSDTGEPLSWTGLFGAFEAGLGDEITDFISNNTDSFVVLCAGSIGIITGNDSTDLVLSILTDEAGATAYTAQRIGVAMYLDNRGLRSISATQQYGNFKLGALTNQIQPLLDRKRKAGIAPVASITVRSKDHYRLFFSDGTGFSLYMGRKLAEPMPFNLGKVVSCITSSEEVDNSERVFFGAIDGFVYELDIGTSFDGGVIRAYVQLPFNHEGGPRLLKRWHKASIEMIAQNNTQIGVTSMFDYGGPEQPGSDQIVKDVYGQGGVWGISEYGDFYWSSPLEGLAEIYLEGQGANMAMTIASEADDQLPYVLQGITFNYSVRGQIR